MAFDTATRNRLNTFVGDARALLTEEFTNQFQVDFGMDPDTGEIAELDRLSHLDDSRRQTAIILRETLAHYYANLPTKNKKIEADHKHLIERIIREQAFTVLNRLCAIRMAEARDLVIESVAAGIQSKGFQLYQPVVGNSLGETAAAYQQYLFSLFDEFAVDLPVLFDRFSPNGRLFPGESVLIELLALINHAEINKLWAEDETIGWIYQYFNSKEERKAMRDASQAPRNSRELAVRNQFFTPRYVVEFLTDNTLGRIWYEMRKGETRLKDECQYLVRRPNEIFLEEGISGQEPVASEEEEPTSEDRPLKTDTDLTQEELLNQPVHIPHRPVKDPREIRMLDPACGSMHFGLYAFDLYLKIYEEAWDSQMAVVGGQWSGDINEQAEILSRVASLAEGDGSRGSDLSSHEGISEGGTVRTEQSTPTNSGVDSVEHRRGTGAEVNEGVSAFPVDRLRISDGDRDTNTNLQKTDLLTSLRRRQLDPTNERDRQDVERAFQFACEKVVSGQSPVVSQDTSDHRPLTTDNSPPHRPLLLDYPDKSEFLKQVPRLIIEHNIHGIDIDPRAVQIAGLSLWLRAQRAWKSMGIAAGDRPQVTRSNVVCAEPMPGDQQQLEAFCQELHPAIAQMVTAIFEEMKLAGEAGSLLKIEQEISYLVASAKKQYQDNPPDKKTQKQLFGSTQTPKQQQLEFDLSGITEEQFFEQAEETIYEALRKYASETSEGGFRRKLFAGDAEKGFAFIEVCRKSYDVALMNPPFGDPVGKGKSLSHSSYKNANGNVLCGFCLRMRELAGQGFLGAITDRTWLQKTTYEEFRDEVLDGSMTLHQLVDMEWGVLDGAQVATCSFVLAPSADSRMIAIDIRDAAVEDKELELNRHIQNLEFEICEKAAFASFPDRAIAHWCLPGIKKLFLNGVRVDPRYGKSKRGISAGDTTRAFRLAWEVPTSSLGINSEWAPLQNGGSLSPFYRDTYLVCNYKHKLEDLRPLPGSVLRNLQWIGKHGFTWSKRTDWITPCILQKDHVFTDEGQAFLVNQDEDAWYLVGFLNSTALRYALNLFCGQHKSNGYVAKLYVPNKPKNKQRIVEIAKEIWSLGRAVSVRCEPGSAFQSPWIGLKEEAKSRPSFDSFLDLAVASDLAVSKKMERLRSELNELASVELDLKPEDVFDLNNVTKDELTLDASMFSRIPESGDQRVMYFDLFFSYFVGLSFGIFRDSGNTAKTDPFSSARFYDQYNSSTAFSVIEEGELARLVETNIYASHVENEQQCSLFCANQSSVRSLVSYLREPSSFFANHINRYTFGKGLKRAAPIYWPISTESGSYTLWFYYHRLTDQTLYKAVNDFVDPKLKQTTRQLADLRAIKDRTSSQEKELAQLTELESELEQFKADLLEIAAFWKPNLNDGVQITAAPLWKFFRLTKWRNKLKKTWEDLESGKYDWAHLALSIWPDRVVREKCTSDRSIAIAHDLEEQLWHEVEVQKTSKSGRVTTKKEWQPRNLTEAQLDTIVKAVKSGQHPPAPESKDVNS